MAVWTYECRSCDAEAPATWHVAAVRADEMPAGTVIVRVKVGPDWRCALLDRTRKTVVDQLLVRDVIESNAAECPGCAARLARQAAGGTAAAAPPVTAAALAAVTAPATPAPAGAPAARRTPTRKVQAAAVALAGKRMIVVLVAMDLVQNPGEADMAMETLAPDFGGVPLVLMAQEDDGSPRYYGDADLVALLEGVPLERMPWKEYPVA